MKCIVTIPVAARSKAWVYSRFVIGFVGSNLTGDMDVCLLCVFRQRSLRRADHPSGRVVLRVISRL